MSTRARKRAASSRSAGSASPPASVTPAKKSSTVTAPTGVSGAKQPRVPAQGHRGRPRHERGRHEGVMIIMIPSEKVSSALAVQRASKQHLSTSPSHWQAGVLRDALGTEPHPLDLAGEDPATAPGLEDDGEGDRLPGRVPPRLLEGGGDEGGQALLALHCGLHAPTVG